MACLHWAMIDQSSKGEKRERIIQENDINTTAFQGKQRQREGRNACR